MKGFAGVVALLAALATGCAGQQGGGGARGPLAEQRKGGSDVASPLGESEVRYGRIARIDPVSLEGGQQLGVGHVLGAVAGGVLGHQFGNGRGRIVGQVLGALGGGYVGGALQKELTPPRPGAHITVTLANGVAVGVTQPAEAGLRVGDCVRIDGSGQSARVVRSDCVGSPVVASAAESTLRQRLHEGAAANRAAAQRIAAAPVPARPLGESPVRYGRILGIETVPIESDNQVGIDGAMNGVSGGALDHPIPGGDAKAFADVANELGHDGGGAPAARFGTPREGQAITVQLDNGVTIGVTQPTDRELRVGDRVRIDGRGATTRVTRT